jgi:phosphate-selective porin OprO/OprP
MTCSRNKSLREWPCMSVSTYLALSIAAISFLFALPVSAQTTENIPGDPSSAYDQAITVPPDPKATTRYDMPDIPKGWVNWTMYDGKWFSYKIGFVPILDYDAFWQDPASIQQVGRQDDQWDIRSFRVSVGGKLKFKLPLKYFVSAEYKGLDRPPGAAGWGTTDVSLAAPLGKEKYGTITVGKVKETFSYEMVGDSANLPQLERLLTAFFTSRNVGVKYNNALFHQRMTISGGWFNDWWSKGRPYDGSSNHFSGRLTAVPVYAMDGAEYLHLGFTTRWIGATDGNLRFRAKPESNVTNDYLDTGNFSGKSATEFGAEALANFGPFSILGEYTDALTDAPSSGNPSFYGYYVTGSWVITGEHRPYDRSVGYARRIIPQHRYGAWELVGRVGRVDLSDKSIHGGILNIYSMNLSWWANRRLRVTVGGGRYDLNQFGLYGTTNQFHGRIQWVY